MSIQILPRQLAHQIAAGEVIERPASVVKELLENSLDAAATQIDIEVEGGGVQLIRIRDNGSGILKTELPLAIASHATSKITSLEDLQAILSFGFRGEALASIHAVSRLLLTSCPPEQEQAWQLYCEGDAFEPLLQPAAHPLGTTLEVRDLFYNTPARRKFLRSEKSEFMQIDELVRRIALAHPAVGFSLRSHGKSVRHYRPVTEESPNRLAAVCGATFEREAHPVFWQEEGLVLQGWVAPAQKVRGQSNCQYCYINQRIIRDKIVQHAIRQAHQEHWPTQHALAFVLFLQIDPQQVDVNVHPAKQEVRFHQARTIYHSIYQAVRAAIVALATPSCTLVEEQAATPSRTAPTPPAFPVSLLQRESQTAHMQNDSPPTGISNCLSTDGIAQVQQRTQRRPPPLAQLEMYQQLLKATATASRVSAAVECSSAIDRVPNTEDSKCAMPSFGRLLVVWQHRYALLAQQHRLLLLSLPVAQRYLYQTQLLQQQGPGRGRPLFIPVQCALSDEQLAVAERFLQPLHALGIAFLLQPSHLILQSLPMLLRQHESLQLMQQILDSLATQEAVVPGDNNALVQWLVTHFIPCTTYWQMAPAIQLLTDIEHCCTTIINTPPTDLLQPLDLSHVIQRLDQDG